jgi:hypothetical protein
MGNGYTTVAELWRGCALALRDGSGVSVRRNRASVSEDGNTASVALKSGRRKVFWCDREASQPKSLYASGDKIIVDNLSTVCDKCNICLPSFLF